VTACFVEEKLIIAAGEIQQQPSSDWTTKL